MLLVIDSSNSQLVPWCGSPQVWAVGEGAVPCAPEEAQRVHSALSALAELVAGMAAGAMAGAMAGACISHGEVGCEQPGVHDFGYLS